MLLGPTIVVLVVHCAENIPLSALISADLANSFLGTMAQVLAGILAIVFSVSVLTVEIASDKYTPRLFTLFIMSAATWLSLVSLLMCILLSVIAIGVQASPMFQWEFLAMTWLFTFCLLTLPYYFQQTLQLLDPRNLAERIKDEGLRFLRKKDEQIVGGTLTSLGDVAIKALGRGEDEAVKRYLDALQEMQQALAVPGSILLPCGGRDVESPLFTHSIPSPAIDQYFRIFKMAIVRKSEELALYVVRLLVEAIIALIDQNSSKEILAGVLQQYGEFARIAIESRDVSRFLLVRALKEAIFRQAHTKTANEEHLPACLGVLGQINRMIIDHSDSELWKEELSYFSDISSVRDISNSLSSNMMGLLRGLQRAGIPVSRENEQSWYVMVWPVATRITPTNRRVFEFGISEIEQLIPASEPQLQEQVQEIRGTLQRLWATTMVYDMFFGVCVYAFYRKEFGYIKELWRHVNPPDASAHWVNINLIHLSIGFLTHQMVGSSFTDWPIERYHGGEIYALQYYLLCLAYALQQSNGDWQPMVPAYAPLRLSQDDEYSVTMAQELSAVHVFLLNLPYHADKVLRQYDTVHGMCEEWDDVFDGKASTAFERARDWLENRERRQDWEQKAQGIIVKLPLDETRVQAYRAAALKYHQSQSQVDQLAVIGEHEEKASTELKAWCRICPDKREFTPIGLGRPSEVITRAGFEAVYRIVDEEIKHIAKTILRHETIKAVRVEHLTFEQVAKMFRKISETAHKATILLAPDDQIHLAWQNDLDFRTHMEHEGNERYLLLDESAKLRILGLDGNYAFVLDRNTGNWVTAKPLVIEVAECSANPLVVQITAQESVEYQVTDPEAVGILEFGSV